MRVIYPLVFILLTWGKLIAQSPNQFPISDTGTSPSIAADDSGQAVVVWLNTGIYYTRFDSLGNVLKDTINVYSPKEMEQFFQAPDVATLDTTDLPVWRNVTIFNYSEILTRPVGAIGDTVSGIYALNVTWYDAERASPCVEPLNDTTFIVVWSGNGPDTPVGAYAIYGQLYTISARYVGLNFVVSDDTTTDQTNFRPTVAPAKDMAHVFVAWLNGISTGNEIKGRILDATGTGVAPSHVIVDNSDFAYIWSPRAAALPNGNTALVWSAEQSDSTWAVFLVDLDSQGVPVGTPLKVNQVEDASYASEIRISSDIDGKRVVVWESRIGGKSRIKAQRIAPDGSFWGGNFIVSSPSDIQDHYYPDVMLKNDRVYVVWQTGFEGIVGRFFSFYDSALEVEPLLDVHPSEIQVYCNYPNPFNPSTTVVIMTSKAMRADLVIFDINGREVKRLFNGILNPGMNRFVWDASDSREPPSSGIYICRLVSDHAARVTKLLLIK